MKSLLTVGCFAFLVAGCAAEDGTSEDVASERIAATQQALSAAHKSKKPPPISELCDRVYEFDHFIDVGDGVRLHVAEKFTGRSVMRFPRRAFLMLPPTLVSNEVYNTSVPGDDEGSFNSLTRAANNGFFAFAMSYEGYGLSTMPEDGKTVTAERSLEHSAAVLNWIRRNRAVPKVDLMGMSLGAAIAVALGGTESPIPRQRVGKVVVTTYVYRNFSPELAPMFGPEFQAFLESLPGGYVDTDGPTYGPVLSHAAPEALAWGFEAFPGRYAVGPTLEAFDLPMFDAQFGRAPMLQVYGDEDPVTPFSDVEDLQNEYGGPASLVVLEGGGHTPMLEPVRDEFWEETFAFVNDDRPKPSLCDMLPPKAGPKKPKAGHGHPKPGHRLPGPPHRPPAF